MRSRPRWCGGPERPTHEVFGSSIVISLEGSHVDRALTSSVNHPGHRREPDGAEQTLVPPQSGEHPSGGSAGESARVVAHVVVERNGNRFQATLAERRGDDGVVRAEVTVRTMDPQDQSRIIVHRMLWQNGRLSGGYRGAAPRSPTTIDELIELVAEALRAHLQLPPAK